MKELLLYRHGLWMLYAQMTTTEIELLKECSVRARLKPWIHGPYPRWNERRIFLKEPRAWA